jgi:hypothetical protein
MEKISGLTINEAEYDLSQKKKGKIAVFMYSGEADPKKVLDLAVSEYVEGTGYHELIDAHLDNPWMRVILSDINGMKQDDFDPTKYKLTPRKH